MQEEGAPKSRLIDAANVATAAHLVRALRGRVNVSKIYFGGGYGHGENIDHGVLCERFCGEYLKKDILSYMSMENIDKTTQSPFWKGLHWEEVYLG